MTVNYIQSYSFEEKRGILSYREFEGIEVTKQKILKSEIYEVLPPFRIQEYFDGTFLFLKLEELFGEGKIDEYELYSERNERMEKKGSVYRVYPDKRYDQEYVIFGKGFIYRLRPGCVFACPFYFKFWSTSSMVYFVARPRSGVLKVECPGLIESDTSKGTIGIPPESLDRQGGFLCVGSHRVGFSPEFYKHYCGDYNEKNT